MTRKQGWWQFWCHDATTKRRWFDPLLSLLYYFIPWLVFLFWKILQFRLLYIFLLHVAADYSLVYIFPDIFSFLVYVYMYLCVYACLYFSYAYINIYLHNTLICKFAFLPKHDHNICILLTFFFLAILSKISFLVSTYIDLPYSF